MNGIKETITGVLALGAVAFGTSMATAAPISGAALLSTVESNPLVQDVRIYCMNRYSGRFLHWGPCGGYRVRYYSRPRYYRRRYYY